MNMKRSLAVAGIMATVGTAGIGGASIVSAQTDSSTSTKPMSGLVQKLATKFNVSQDEVQAAFDADRTEREAERTKQLETDLSTLVTDGKITADQKQKILDKRAELQKEHEANRTAEKDTTKTMADRKTEMDAKQTELKKWASDNGIAEEYLKYVMGGGHGGPDGGRGGPRSDHTTTRTTTNE